MTFSEMIEMFEAMETERPLSVGFQLQHSSEGQATIQDIGQRIGAGRMAQLLQKIAQAEPPEYLTDAEPEQAALMEE